MKQFKIAVLVILGLAIQQVIHPGDVMVDWDDAVIENDEWDVLYNG